MSRLWISTTSDLRKGTGKGSSTRSSTQINWGSAGDSKRAACIEVVWPKDQDRPLINITIGESENPLPNEVVNIVHYKGEEKNDMTHSCV